METVAPPTGAIRIGDDTEMPFPGLVAALAELGTSLSAPAPGSSTPRPTSPARVPTQTLYPTPARPKVGGRAGGVDIWLRLQWLAPCASLIPPAMPTPPASVPTRV